MSLPNVQVLHDRFKDDPQVSVLAVHYEDRGAICGHMTDHEFSFPLIPNGIEVIRRFDVIRFPTILVVGPDGRVIYNNPGHRISDEIRDELEELALAARSRAGS